MAAWQRSHLSTNKFSVNLPLWQPGRVAATQNFCLWDSESTPKKTLFLGAPFLEPAFNFIFFLTGVSKNNNIHKYLPK